jgi:hypothetical protein
MNFEGSEGDIYTLQQDLEELSGGCNDNTPKILAWKRAVVDHLV